MAARDGSGRAERAGVPTAARRRVRVRVEGTVQGVGFRPHVHGLATRLGLAGHVLNDERGVLLEVEGEPGAVGELLERLARDAPPPAIVERVASEELAVTGQLGFAIAASAGAGRPEAAVSADLATCDRCLAELLDPADRRHRYPFVNCTSCGPRFTIVRGVPYDRALTTMAGFEMCERCRAEYEDPRDRRFHAQPNACPECGPRARLVGRDGREVALRDALDPVAAAAESVLGGRIVAVKGIGGFHLACRADDEAAVVALRSRKRREDRPFAVMAPDLAGARELVELSGAEEELLLSPRRPIVVAGARAGGAVAESVAPRSRELGVMLPYSPLHHLLLADAGTALVMTSGNLSDEPIAHRDEDAVERLAPIADLILLHDRPIETRTDDSVVRSRGPGSRGGPILIRRSRGHVPESLELPLECRRPLLACGAELKSAFCLARGGRAWPGHHIGDLRNYETLRSFEAGIERFQRLFAVAPELVAHDLHPEYLSTRYALERDGVERLAVQHHHAHLAACLAEHGERGPALGAIFDGTGLGTDGTIWGGELLAGGLEGFERAGMLWPVRIPGGEAAIREPWRMACAWVAAASGTDEPEMPDAIAAAVDPAAWRAVCELIRSGVNSPVTSSVGRLFDAVAAICGIRGTVHHEGQAAAELEAAADPRERGAYELPPVDAGVPDGALILDARETVRLVLAELAAGVEPAIVSARFHNGLVGGTARACAEEAGRRGLDAVVLSGGAFQNRILLERTARALGERGLRVLVPERLPPNDGGISYGQAAVAAATG